MNTDFETPEVESPLDGEVIERIDKSTLVPLYDTNHEHTFVADPEDETDDYYAEMCVKEGCNLGRLIAK